MVYGCINWLPVFQNRVCALGWSFGVGTTFEKTPSLFIRLTKGEQSFYFFSILCSAALLRYSVNDTVKTIVSDKRPSSAMSVKEMGNIDCLNVEKLLTLLKFLSKDTPVINKQSGSAILDES